MNLNFFFNKLNLFKMKNLNFFQTVSILVFFIHLVSFQHLHSQNCSSIVYRAITSNSKPIIANQITTGDPDVNSVLQKYSISSIVQHRPNAKTQRVRDLYRIELKNSTQIAALTAELKQLSNIDEVIMLCEESTLESLTANSAGKTYSEESILLGCSNPATYNDPSLQNGGDWFLTGMNVPCAWSLTHGDPSMSVAVVDIFFNNSNEDLQGKFSSLNNCNPIYNGCGHGFATSGAVSAIVNNGFCSAGTGYNTKVAGYCVAAGCTSGNPGSGIWDAYQDGHKIISVSFSDAQLTLSEAQEMVDNGVTLVVTAYGNNNQSIRGINGVIHVGQADINRNHEDYPIGEFTPGVDIYALCIDVVRLQAFNQCSVGTGNTSFGAPSVAGIVALMKSVNPCLTPADIENIIKATHSGLPANASNYNGQITAGIIDAYAAVQMAQTYQGTDVVISQNTIYDTDKVISGDLVIESGAQLTVNSTATLKFNEGSRLLVKRGAKLVVDGGTLTINCGSKWLGIRVEGNANDGQALSHLVMPTATQAGTVVLINGATISKAVEGISMDLYDYGWPAMQNYWGGLVYANNANFIDNWRACSFMKNIGIERSKFLNCTFKSEKYGVTIWDADGVEFVGNDFKQYSATGIVAYDANINVHTNNIFTGSQYSKSISLVQTIMADNGSIINNNVFDGGLYGVHSQASNNRSTLMISNNSFNGTEYGSYQSGLTNSELISNDFNQNEIATFNLSTGLNQNFLRMNLYTGNALGQYFAANNEGTEFYDNCHAGGSYDNVFFAAGGMISSVYPEQMQSNSNSSIPIEAGNKFTRMGSPSFTKIVANQNINTIWTKFNYHLATGTTITNFKYPINAGGSSNLILDATMSDACNGFNGVLTVADWCKISNEWTIQQAQIAANQWTNEINTLQNKLAYTDRNNPDDIEIIAKLKAQIITRQQCLRRVKKLIIVKKKEEGKLQTAKSEYINEPDFTVKIAYFSALVDVNDLTTANAYLDDIQSNVEEESDFVQAQKINLERLANPRDYVLTPAKKSLLYNLGNKYHPASGYARSIYTVLTGEYIELDFPKPGSTTLPRSKDELNITQGFAIYPNPGKDYIDITFGSTGDKKLISIMTFSGLLVKNLNINEKSENVRIDISNLPNGVYIVKYSDVNGIQTRKFVKI